MSESWHKLHMGMKSMLVAPSTRALMNSVYTILLIKYLKGGKREDREIELLVHGSLCLYNIQCLLDIISVFLKNVLLT
jgi:collagenase-like PrtC family protease